MAMGVLSRNGVEVGEIRSTSGSLSFIEWESVGNMPVRSVIMVWKLRRDCKRL